MNLKELLEIAKTKPRQPACVWTMSENVGVYDSVSSPDSVRLEEVWISHWLCTDTQVGEKAYFLDGEFVAYSIQPARKSNEEFLWASKDAYGKVKDYIESLLDREEYIPVLTDEHLNVDQSDHYTVDYAGQLLPGSQAYWHDGIPVTFIRKELGAQAYSSEAYFRKDDGEEVLTPLDRIAISYFNKGE